MKRILFVINTLGGAGAEKALLELLQRFPQEEYEIDLYVLLDQGELIRQIPPHIRILNREVQAVSVLSKEGKQQLNKHVMKRLLVNGALLKNFGYLVKNTLQMVKNGKLLPDKLLWRVMSDSGQKLEKSYDIAVAYLEGGSTYYVHDHVKADRKYAFLHVDYERAGYSRSLDQECYLDFDRVFTVSDEVKQVFLTYYPECAASTSVFHNLLNSSEIQRKSLLPGGFSDEYQGKRILTVGRLTAQKAYEVAIDAMKLLKEQGVTARWYVLGEGEQRAKLQQKIRSLGLTEDFILLGAVENPYPYYKACDLYVHATRYEGKSIAVQEAQILGCPILVSDCSGNREQVTDRVDGELCSLDAEALARSIKRLLEDEETCRQYGINASKRENGTSGNVLDLF